MAGNGGRGMLYNYFAHCMPNSHQIVLLSNNEKLLHLFFGLLSVLA